MIFYLKKKEVKIVYFKSTFLMTVFYLKNITFLHQITQTFDIYSLLFLIVKLLWSDHGFKTAITPSSVILMALESATLSKGLQSMKVATV